MLKFSKYFHLFPIFLICFFYSVDKYVIQSVVDGGLILSGLVSFPENFSNITSTFFNSYTILHYFALILLKYGFSIDTISIILTFIIITFYALGIFYLTFGITKSKNLALLLSLITIIFRNHFGNVDYVVLFFAEHSFGAFSLAAFTFIVGLLANKNFKVAGLITALLLSSHLVVGLWTLLLFIFIFVINLFFLNSSYNNCKEALGKILLGSSIWLLPIVVSFIFYASNTIDNSSYNLEDFNTYINVWDYHRNIYSINYNYIFKTLFLILLVIIYFYNFKQKENLIFIIFVLSTCVISLLIYLFFKIVPNSFIPQIFINSMSTRVFILHSVIGYPLLISILYFIFKQSNFKLNFNFKRYKKFIILTPFILVLILLFAADNSLNKSKQFYTNKIEKRFLKFSDTLFKKKMNEEDFFWEEIRKIKSNGYYITTFESSGPTLRYGRKPHILNTSFIDTVAYFPYQATETKLILENIYGLSFKEPPIKFLGAVIDDWFKEIFEQRTNIEWQEISEKYNISGIIVPSDWKLFINDKIVSQKFTAYLFDKNN